MQSDILSIIQAMLAPGLMISACGLLLLGISNRYSLVVTRIRLLNQEKRKIAHKAGLGNLDFDDENRLLSIVKQIDKLTFRVRLVRDAVVSYAVAIAFVVISSMLIGLDFIFDFEYAKTIAIIFFIIGVFSVLVGIIFAGYEVILGHRIILFEVKAEE